MVLRKCLICSYKRHRGEGMEEKVVVEFINYMNQSTYRSGNSIGDNGK